MGIMCHKKISHFGKVRESSRGETPKCCEKLPFACSSKNQNFKLETASITFGFIMRQQNQRVKHAVKTAQGPPVSGVSVSASDSFPRMLLISLPVNIWGY